MINRRKHRPKIGLALGGGGARGLAHIGVLKTLEREMIPVDMISGTSIGALVGAAYAVNPDARALEKRVLEVLGPENKEKTGFKLLEKAQWDAGSKSDFLHRIVRIAQKGLFLNLALFRDALLTEHDMRGCVEAFLPDIDISETTLPFAAVTVDLVSGRRVVLKHGPLIQAVTASCAVPGFMPAVKRDGMILVDGGVVDSIPVGPAKEWGADVIIAVDVGSHLDHQGIIEDGIDAINRVTHIMAYNLSTRSREIADLLIEPEVREIGWTEFPNYAEIIRRGEQSAALKIEEIRKILELPFYKKLFLSLKGIGARLGINLNRLSMHLSEKTVQSSRLKKSVRLAPACSEPPRLTNLKGNDQSS